MRPGHCGPWQRARSWPNPGADAICDCASQHRQTRRWVAACGRPRFTAGKAQGGKHMTGRCGRLLVAMVPWLLVAHAARAWEPDPALVAAAQKEGQVVWYTGLIVNQISR